ncbi:hypothetical protein HGM15179_011037 [Zosterops borbonicus]|uniref:Uncharacterized protein n=1 Tax=Zosterops borbonicus TaxID=364589 RepID=A0A8K1LJL2_9PASS|nr:hypothetical protein HGM15179_011037 [Zosterops borbonicus]
MKACVLIFGKIKWIQVLLNMSGHVLQRGNNPVQEYNWPVRNNQHHLKVDPKMEEQKIESLFLPYFLSIGFEKLEMLDSQVLEFHLMAAINVIFSAAFLGKIHDEHKDVAVHLKETRRALRIAGLGLSILF